MILSASWKGRSMFVNRLSVHSLNYFADLPVVMPIHVFARRMRLPGLDIRPDSDNPKRAGLGYIMIDSG